MGRMISRLTLPGSLAQVRHVSPVRPRHARGLVAGVYAQVERDFGVLAPPVVLHSPAPEVLAGCWLLLRESLVAVGAVTRAIKEAVAAEVSAGNACPYCVSVHEEVRRGLVAGDQALARPGIERVTAWARASGVRDMATGHGLPLRAEHVRELVAVVVTFQYLNRMVNVFLGDSPLPPQVPPGARIPAMRLLGLLMRPATRRPLPPGASLTLLPAAPLPADLSWAEGTPHLAGAFARAAAAIEEGGRRSVPDAVRELVAGRLAGWDGQPAGLGRGWVVDASSGLPAAQRPAARLALLAALASHQVDPSVVAEFRRAEPDERALVELTAWASLAAARRVGSWLPIARPSRI
ncbi:carboxymuconolactone decarboxylase family protein [Planomonospora sp. ID67723]|uniref:carboxymuconolactone decarboxylase family protein n=1 Tax=Planomonospora sp. ID67723 TaxID=2738134 RepID=UPI0018C42325|nr:carboxymuconolactone decarboxylase family protein [Planomonospora sp. ID67723]MBG0829070.1 carboxymuconolactone decarboxylase family protein [Planomonospora sp. ID67723]